MREIKACIFDMDGVICDTAKYHYLAWKALADDLGITFTEEDNEKLKGISRDESLELLLSLGNQSYSKEEKVGFADKKNKRYVEYISNMNQDEILPGVLEILDYCRENKIKIALGSVSKNAGMILKNLRLEPYFDSVIDGNKVKRAKPDPEVFLKGAEETGQSPEYCVVFEDAQSGIKGARAAGMRAVGIGNPYILKEADLVIDNFCRYKPKELLQIITDL